jgi:hypothetical protein
MHEFGHNINLQHGGGDANNFKPNYVSIMNYAFQSLGIAPTDPDGAGPLTARIYYSAVALAALNENNLNEPGGIGDGTDRTRFTCPNGTAGTGPGTGAIDWNCDADGGADAIVAVDVNGSGTFGVLTGFDDWANLRLTFQPTRDFEDGVHNTATVVEIDHATQSAIAKLVDVRIDPTAINCKNAGVIVTVAALTTPTFDARSLVETTVTFAGARETHVNASTGKPQRHEVDVDGDGDIDLVFHFRLGDTNLTCAATRATLSGQTVTGQAIEGSGRVNMIGQ